MQTIQTKEALHIWKPSTSRCLTLAVTVFPPSSGRAGRAAHLLLKSRKFRPHIGSLFKQWCHNFLISLLSSCICSINDSPSPLDLGHFSLLTSAFTVFPLLPVTFASLCGFAFVLSPLQTFLKPLTLSGSSPEELHSRGFHYLVSLSSCSLQTALYQCICPT